MTEKIKKQRLEEQSATGKAVFTISILISGFYFVQGAILIPFPDMTTSSFAFQFNHVVMGFLNFACGLGLILSAIPIHHRQYYSGSTCILGISIIGFIIGGGFLVSPLWGLAAAIIGFMTNPLEYKLFERKMGQS